MKNFICILLSCQLLIANAQSILPITIVQNKIEQEKIIENKTFQEETKEIGKTRKAKEEKETEEARKKKEKEKTEEAVEETKKARETEEEVEETKEVKETREVKEKIEMEEKEKEEIKEDLEKNFRISESYSSERELYKKKSGYFYIFVRKEGEKLEDGVWYRIAMNVDSLSAQVPQKINWSMKYLKEQKGSVSNINHWIWSNLQFLPTGSSGDTGVHSLQLEQKKVWKTGQDGYGTNPIFGEWADNLEDFKEMGLPYPQRYYMLCGQFLFQMPGYRMYFDTSVFENMDSMDIEKENAQIQKQDDKLNKGEKSWTGDGYFQFAIDTNNVGMTASGASGEFHHSIYGFYLKPNKYTIKYNKNGGTGSMSAQKNLQYDKTSTLKRNTFTRTGYKFTGWKDESGNFYDDEEEIINLTTEHGKTVTLYAQWQPNELLILYHANGGSTKSDYSLQNNIISKNGIYIEKHVIYNETEKINLHNVGNLLRREGYHIDPSNAWCIKKANGTAISQEEITIPKELLELLKDSSQIVILYANWKPNTLSVGYHANGGDIIGTPSRDITTFVSNWTYHTEAKTPAKMSSFGLSRLGYKKKIGKEWNTKADGTGRAFDQNVTYLMTDYAPNLKTGNRNLTLYAQWEPKIYTIQLDCQLKNPKNIGTDVIYEKYETGWYLDVEGRNILHNKKINKKIEIPKKEGYQFKGYFTKKSGGIKMIDASGNLTTNGIANYQILQNTTWYAQYEYKIICEDYADIPCDFQKTDLDVREDIGFLINYDKKTKKIIVKTNQKTCTVTLIGKKAGIKIGKFQSSILGNSISATSENTKNIFLSMVPLEGAAYQIKITVEGKIICDRLIYFQNGRFRTLVKLGVKEGKIVKQGTNISGSRWGTESNYFMYQYVECSELKNIIAPGTVYRYFQYKDVNIAYNGNGATFGANMLETGVSLENIYQLRKNEFTRKEIQTKQTVDKKKYKCEVTYAFIGWKLGTDKFYQEHEQEELTKIYGNTVKASMDLSKTLEPIETYKIVSPIVVENIILNQNLIKNKEKIENKNLINKKKELNNTKIKKNISEYINICAEWNAFPTLVITPGKELEFYEGESVTKEDLIKNLIAHDEEDNCKDTIFYKENLNNKIRIVKIFYPKSKNGSQKSYEKIYEEDVAKDFLLDTYYLKLEPEETIEVQVTFAVTDSNGNTTKEVFPVKVKYNNYPEINSEDIFYYFKEEANRGEITEETLIKRAIAKDIEDGEITNKLQLKDFNPEIICMQTEVKTEFNIIYQVVDAYKKTTYKTVKLIIWDEEAILAEKPKAYVRYISPKYLNTLEAYSIWRESDNYEYLTEILSNEVPLETWNFTHKDVLAIKEWLATGGKDNFKIGQETNKAFLSKFSFCKE